MSELGSTAEGVGEGLITSGDYQFGSNFTDRVWIGDVGGPAREVKDVLGNAKKIEGNFTGMVEDLGGGRYRISDFDNGEEFEIGEERAGVQPMAEAVPAAELPQTAVLEAEMPAMAEEAPLVPEMPMVAEKELGFGADEAVEASSLEDLVNAPQMTAERGVSLGQKVESLITGLKGDLAARDLLQKRESGKILSRNEVARLKNANNLEEIESRLRLSKREARDLLREIGDRVKGQDLIERHKSGRLLTQRELMQAGQAEGVAEEEYKNLKVLEEELTSLDAGLVLPPEKIEEKAEEVTEEKIDPIRLIREKKEKGKLLTQWELVQLKMADEKKTEVAPLAQIDFGTTEGEIEAEKAKKRAEMAEVEAVVEEAPAPLEIEITPEEAPVPEEVAQSEVPAPVAEEPGAAMFKDGPSEAAGAVLDAVAISESTEQPPVPPELAEKEAQPTPIDFGTSAEEIEAEKARKRAETPVTAVPETEGLAETEIPGTEEITEADYDHLNGEALVAYDLLKQAGNKKEGVERVVGVLRVLAQLSKAGEKGADIANKYYDSLTKWNRGMVEEAVKSEELCGGIVKDGEIDEEKLREKNNGGMLLMLIEFLMSMGMGSLDLGVGVTIQQIQETLGK